MPSQDLDANVLHPLPTTHWSLVGRAGQACGVERRAALDALLRRYLPALRSHLIVRKRIPDHRADDLLQGFLLSKVIESDFLLNADRRRGRFRTYVLTALDRHTIDEGRRERAAKRSPDQTPILVEDIEPADDEIGPSQVFDLDWAQQVMIESARRMQTHCLTIARADIWGIFEARLLGPMLHGNEPMPYDQLIDKYQLPSPAEAFNLLNSAKRMFLRTVRGVIGEYERDPAEIEAEFNDLRRILSNRRA